MNVAIPKEGAVLGIDTIGIMKGSKNADLAYKFINMLLDPERAERDRDGEEGQPGRHQCQARSGGRQAARRLHDAGPMEQGSTGDRPQAPRREDRRMETVVHRKRHQLMPSAGSALRRPGLLFACQVDPWIIQRLPRRPIPVGARSSVCSPSRLMLVAIVFTIAMAAILQYSVRAHIPGSLDVGGFTLANFHAMLRPLYARVFADTVWFCLLTAVHQPRARLSARLCAGAIDAI